MNVQHKDLVLLSYPFSNLKESKVRPAIVISNDLFNSASADCLMVPLTTVLKDEPYSILINSQDLSSGKLLKPSRIRADKIFTVEKKLILAKIGTLKDTAFEKLKLEILKLF